MNSFKHSIKQTIFSVSHINNEEPTLLQIIDNLKLTPDQKLLDVGCGYGFKLKLLQKFNFKTIGVEVNAEIVKVNRASGLSCVSVEEFAAQKEQYDVMLMSHIIEHFNPKDLLKFVNFYLDRLKPGGYLIIITPLFTERFYNDFDHIKPYYPTGLRMVFGQEGEQVQYYSPNKLDLEDIWFLKSPRQLNLSSGIYVAKRSRLPNYFNLLLRFLYLLSFGLISQKDSWIGLYKKK